MFLGKDKNKDSKYIDTTGELPNVQLKFGVWYLKHKILIQNIGIGVLVAFCVLTIGFSLWKWGDYLIYGYWEDEQTLLLGQVAQFQNYDELKSAYKAQDLNVSNVRAFSSAEDMYDFIAQVANPNERWIANVEYHFTYSGEETKKYTSAVLPGSKRPVAVFGHDSNKFPSNVQFVIDKISWKSISAHDISDVSGYVDARNRFSIDNFVFNTPSDSGILVPSITFDLYNDSAYSYWAPEFYVELLNGNQTVGYIFLRIDRFNSAEVKEIDLRYFGGNITVTNIRVIPVVNFFDNEVYMSPGL